MSSIPLFAPGVAVSMVVALAACTSLGRALGVRQPVAWALVVALGIVLAATLTPQSGALEYGATGTGSCDLNRIGPAPLATLIAANQASANVLLFVPLGTVIGLLPRSRRKMVVLAAAIALPFAVEALQLLVTVLDRGCQSADVADNLTGLFVGLAVGSVARWFAATRIITEGPDSRSGPR